MPGATRRIFIAGYYGFGNAGDEAILAALLADLRALRPDLEFVVASGNPADTENDHGVPAVSRDDLPTVAAEMAASDLVLLGGGGLFQDYWEVPLEAVFTVRSGGLPFYAGFVLLAELLGKPSMICAVGVGPLTTDLGRRLTRTAFELCQGATVRDAESLAVLAGLGVSPVEVAADPVWGLVPAGEAELASVLADFGIGRDEKLLGVALRPWSFGPASGAWEAEVAKALDRVVAETGERLLFLPFQLGEDAEAHRRVRAGLAAGGRAVLVERSLAPAELAGLLGRCGRVLAMRYHAALFSLAAGVPVAALAYDPKVSSLLAGAGLSALALPPERWTAGAIAAVLETTGEAREKGKLAGFQEEMRRRAGRSAALAIEVLDRGVGEPSEGRRLTFEVAAGKALSAFRLEGELGKAKQERDALREQRDRLRAERNDLAHRLEEVEGTVAYRLVSRFWRLMGRLFPEGSRRRTLYRGVRGLAARMLGMRRPPVTAEASGGPPPDLRADLLALEDRARASGARRVVAIFSATQLLESEGQRPTQLALTLARRGIPVIFVYWRWWEHEWCPQDRLEEGIVQVPIDVVAKSPEVVTGAFEGMERIALFEFPWPGFFETLATASSAGWITVYDVLDDWEEFHRVGQAVWYDEELERHMIGATDAVFAINEVLAGRIRGLGGEAVEVVGNGLKPGLEVVHEPRPLGRGEITVGYFGYLAGAWFDWELIAEAARRRPSWRFYLIGYGGSPEGIDLPETVSLLGKQPQGDLAAYAANWDVAVIPFKPDRLAAGADPIKTYEYLAMGLPVVATGVHPPAGGEAFVTRAEGVEAFVRAIEAAAAGEDPGEVAARRAFAAACTWDHRLDAILGSLAAGRQRVAEKRALFGAPP